MPLKRSAKGQTSERIAQLTVAFLVEDGKPPPSEFPIFKMGNNESSKGIFKFTKESGRKCMEAAAKYGNDLAIDYGHMMHSFLQVDPATGLAAAGWFAPAVRDDGGLYATKVSWTPKATEKLTAREFRYHSAVFRFSEDGEVTELLSVGLTNTPAMYGQTPLMASALSQLNPSQPLEPDAMELAQLIALLSLADGTTEAQALAELARRQAAFMELTALSGQKDFAGVLGAVKAWKAGSEQVAALSTRVGELEKQLNEGEVTALLSAAQKAGKVTPAEEPMLRTMPVDQLKAYLSVKAPVAGIKPGAKEPGAGTGTLSGQVAALTAEEKHAARLMGLSLEEVAKAKASVGGQVLISEMTPPAA